MIRLLVVDDHAVVRRGLIDLFAHTDGMEVIGEADDGTTAVAATTQLEPDVVLMDLSMPQMDGVDATRRIRAEAPNVVVIVLTSFSEQNRILEAIDAGAAGYLLKDAEPDELVRGVRAAASGEAPFSPKAARALLTFGTQRRAAEALTAREREVLECVGRGMANKQIARRLGISEKTVKSHLTSVFQRIGVTDRTQAALWAQRHGVLDDSAGASAREP